MLGFCGFTKKILKNQGKLPAIWDIEAQSVEPTEPEIPEEPQVPTGGGITASGRVITVHSGTKYAYNSYFDQDITIDLDNAGSNTIYNCGEGDMAYYWPNYEDPNETHWEEVEATVWGDSRVWAQATYNSSTNVWSISTSVKFDAPTSSGVSNGSLFYFQLDSSGNIINIVVMSSITKVTSASWMYNSKTPSSSYGAGTSKIYTPETLTASNLLTDRSYSVSISSYQTNTASYSVSSTTWYPCVVTDQNGNVLLDQTDTDKYELQSKFSFVPQSSSVTFTITYRSENSYNSWSGGYPSSNTGTSYYSSMDISTSYAYMDEVEPTITVVPLSA